MLAAWGEASGQLGLETRSGRVLRVRHRSEAGKLLASLSGEARIVFIGELAELFNSTS
jgi:hypothetical protein